MHSPAVTILVAGWALLPDVGSCRVVRAFALGTGFIRASWFVGARPCEAGARGHWRADGICAAWCVDKDFAQARLHHLQGHITLPPGTCSHNLLTSLMMSTAVPFFVASILHTFSHAADAI